MENLLFSLNATLPVAFMILLGYALKHFGWLKKSFVDDLNRFTYNVTLPFMLLANMRSVDFSQLWDPAYIWFCAGVTVVCFALITLAARWVVRQDAALRAEWIQGSFRGSAVLLAFAYVQNIYGTVTVTSLMVLGTVPLYNLLSAALLSFTDPTGDRSDKSLVRQTLINLLRNPVIIGVAIGVLGSVFQPHFPKPVEDVLDDLAGLTSPLALICLGASFEWRDAKAHRMLAALGSLTKLMLQPLLLLPVAIALGLRGEKLVASLVMLGSPTSVTSYVMARNTNHDGGLTASLVVLTTVLSTLSITFWIYILRMMDLI